MWVTHVQHWKQTLHSCLFKKNPNQPLTFLQELAAVADAQVHQLEVVTMVISQVSRSQHSRETWKLKQTLTVS